RSPAIDLTLFEKWGDVSKIKQIILTRFNQILKWIGNRLLGEVMKKGFRNRLYVGIALIPYFIGSWIIFDKFGKMTAVASSLMIIGALLAYHVELRSKDDKDSKESNKK
ncbi:MAG TPA: hypothetical protein P5533_03755, partial [Candidatus Cloacimonadota bacterium]|nr:hypothetical protein [Candidatus Cloacimonadota bacterium]